MTEGRVSGHILKLFFPILGGSLFQQMYGLADAMIVGRYLGKEALGAVGGSSILVINFILYLIIGLANGITVVAAQAYGSGQRERYRQIEREAVRLTLTAGILFAAAGTCLAEQILKWMDTPEEMMELSVIYLRTYSISFLPALQYGRRLAEGRGGQRQPSEISGGRQLPEFDFGTALYSGIPNGRERDRCGYCACPMFQRVLYSLQDEKGRRERAR